MLAQRDINAAAIIGSLFLLFGSGFSVGGGLMLRNSFRKAKYWKKCQGTVVDYTVYNSNSPANKHFNPKIQFTSDDGKEVTFVASTGSSAQSYQIGDTVNVRYLVENPEKADLDSFVNLWAFAIMLAFFGVGFLSVGLYLGFRLITDLLKP